MSIRFPLRSLATLVLAIGVATCSDAPNAVVKTAPDAGQPGKGRFAISPRFSPQAAAVYAQRATFAAVNFDHVRIVLTRPPTEIVIDTIITFNPSSPPTTLDLFVDVKATAEVFEGAIRYTNNGVVVYEASGKVQSYPPDQVAPTPQELVVVYVGPGATATRLAVSPKTSSVVSPGAVAFNVLAFDAQNNAVNNVPIVWSISDASVASLSTTSGASTTVTPTGKRGTVTVTAAGPLTGLSDNGALTVTLPPSGIVLISGGGQTGKAGNPLTSPGVVRVVASDGVGVPGIAVQFSPPSGGSVGSATATTDAQGNASSSLTLGGAVGAQSFAASAAGFSVSIPASATPGDPSLLAAVSGQGQTDTVSRSLKAPFVVKVSDRFGNGVSNVAVTWARTSGSGTLTGTSSTTGADGTASIGYTLGATGGAETVTASVAGIATPVTFTATAVTGPSGIAIVSGNAQAGRVGQALAAPLVVKVTDAANAPVGGAVVIWSATNATVSGGATTDAQGQASASLTLGNTVGTASATATVGTGANAKSVTFSATVQAGTVAKIVFKTGPSTAAVGAVIAPSIEVELQDAGGNRTNAVNAVTLAIGTNPGQATLGGTLTRAAVAGVATFNDITLSSAGTGYTLIASSAGVSNIASAPFDVTGAAGPNRTWTGAVSTDWSAAGNWNGGVPTSANNAIIPSGAPNQPVLTAGVQINDVTLSVGATLSLGNFNLVSSGSIDALGPITATQGSVILLGAGKTVRGSLPNVLVNGSIAVNGAASMPVLAVNAGGSFTVAGNTASLGSVAVNGGTLSIGAGATVSMTTLGVLQSAGRFQQTGGTVAVATNVLFDGGSSVGQITGGTLSIAGSFTQLATNNTSSFVASGTHRTIFASATAQTISIASPAQTRFANLELDGPGTLTTNAAITATGQLISLAGATTLNGGGATITVAGLDVNGLTLDNAPLISTGGTIAAFDNVTMQSHPATATPLTIAHPGTATPLTFNNTQFLVTPTSGAYLSVTDANPSDGIVLTINLASSTPANGSAQTATSGGALVNWLGTGAAIAWTNAAGGSWSTPSNWSLGRVPGVGDSIVIALSGTYTIQLDTTFIGKYITLGATAGTQTLVLNGRLLTLNNVLTVNLHGVFQAISSTISGAGTVDNQGTLSLQSSTVNLPVLNQDLLVARGTGVVAGALTTSASSIIRAEGNGQVGNATFVSANGFTNNGTIEMTALNSTFTAGITVPNGTLTNAASGTITTLAGAGGSRVLDAQLNNQGLLVTNQPLTLARASAAHTNSGTFRFVNADFTLTTTGGSLTNTGNIEIGSGHTFSITGGAFNMTSGALSQTGILALTSVNATFTTNFTNATTQLSLATSTVNGPGTITNASGQSLALVSTVFAANTSLINQGSLLVTGTTTINGPLTTVVGSVINVQGNGTVGNAVFTVANGFTNNGDINLNSANSAFAATLDVPTGTLVNSSTGTINTVVGASGPRTLSAQLDNQGIVTLNIGLTMNRPNSVITSSGTFAITGGDLTVTQSGAGSFTNSGTLTIAGGRTFTITGATFNQSAGSFGGGGTLALASTTANFAQPFTNATTTIAISSSTINGPGTITNAAGRTINFIGSTIGATSALINQGTFVATGTSAINGPLTNAAGSMLRIQGNGTVGNSVLTVANGFTNAGDIELTTINSAFAATLAVTNGSLTNASTGTIASLAGAAGPRNLNVELINQLGGTVTVQQAMTIARSSGVHTNGGAINLAGGDLTISQSGTTPTFTNANSGTMTVAAGQTFVVSGGGFTHAPGASMTGAGGVSLNATTADFQTGFTLGSFSATGSTANLQTALSTTGMTTSLSSSTLTSTSTITNATGQQLTLQSSTIGAASGFTNQGTVLVTGASAINNAFTTVAGSMLRLQGNGTVGNSALTVQQPLTNNGTIELTTINSGFSTTLNVTGGTLTNSSTGVIASLVGAGGPRVLNVMLSNAAGGTMNIDQPLTINRASSQHVNNGGISISGTGNLTLTQSGTSPSFLNNGTIAVAPAGGIDVTGGVFSTPGNLNGGGTYTQNGGSASFGNAFVLSGVTLTNVTGAFAQPVTTANLALTFTSSSISGGPFTNVAGQTMTVVATTFGAATSVINQGTLLVSGVSGINGTFTAAAASTLRVQGNGAVGNATLAVQNGFTNDGLIDLTTINSGFTATLNVAAGSLTNSSTGTIVASAGAGGSRLLTAQLVNQAGGTVTVAAPLTMSRAGSTHTNAGLIELTSGDLTLTPTSGTFTNNGVLTIGTGRTLTVNAGAFTQASGATVNGGGRLAISGATGTINTALTLSNFDIVSGSTVTFGVPFSTTGMALSIQSSAVNSSGNFSITNVVGQTMTVRASTLSLGTTTVVNAGLLQVEDSTTFGAAVTNTGTIHIEATSGAHGIMALNTLNNNSGGLVELSSIAAGWVSAIRVTGTLFNNAGATITGVGTPRRINGNVTNAGTINVSSGAATGLITIFGNLTNSGGTLNFRISQFGGIYDQLQVTGTLTLGVATPTGTLNASLLTAFTPAPGTNYQLITNYTSALGGIASYNLPTASWTHAQGTTINITSP
jgi:hypothetical protein